eukprot:5414519-Pyramimonas_sp.AAC.1
MGLEGEGACEGGRRDDEGGRRFPNSGRRAPFFPHRRAMSPPGHPRCGVAEQRDKEHGRRPRPAPGAISRAPIVRLTMGIRAGGRLPS